MFRLEKCLKPFKTTSSLLACTPDEFSDTDNIMVCYTYHMHWKYQSLYMTMLTQKKIIF